MSFAAHTRAPRVRLPAYGRELAEKLRQRNDGRLFVTDDFKTARRLQYAPRIVVTPADNPWLLDLSCARGCEVMLLAASYGPHLMPLIEALAVAGAISVDMLGPDGAWYAAWVGGKPHPVYTDIFWLRAGGYC